MYKGVNSYLVSKCLWRIIYNNSLGKIAPQYTQIFDIVAIDTNTMFTK